MRGTTEPPLTGNRKSASDLVAIYEAGLAVTGIIDLPQVLQSLVESAARLLGADVVTLYRYDQDRGRFVPPRAAVGANEGFEKQKAMPSSTGSAAKIACTGRPIIANKAAEEPDMSQGFIKAEGVVSSAGFPLKVQDNVVGVLFLNYRRYHEFTADDIEKVSIFANTAAIAMRNAELFKQQQAVTKRLQVLQQANQAIDSASELREVLTRILDEGLKIVETERGSLMLIEGENLVNKCQFGPELNEPDRVRMSFKIGEGIVGHVAQSREAYLCPDVLDEPLFKPPPKGKILQFRSLLAVPIISSDGEVIGVISADDPVPGHFDETHKQLLCDMAGQFCSAIERMILLETLRALYKILQRLTSVAILSRDPAPVLEEIAVSAIDVLKIDVITIYQYNQTQGKFLTPPLMKGVTTDMPMQTPVFEGEAPWVLVHQLKRHHYAPDAPNDPIMNPGSRPKSKGLGFTDREGIKSSAGLLLTAGDEIVGVMFVSYRTFHSFGERDKQIIETFASGAALAIQDARQWEDLRAAQDQLVQTAKMSAVGTLAAGVAHEIRNPLASISSAVDVILLGYVPKAAIPAKLEEIKKEVTRAGAIIENLLSFVRPSEGAPSPVNLMVAISEALNLLQNEALLRHIIVDTQLQPVPDIEGNATLLKQVFFNIMRNALEAMPAPAGGRLTVRLTCDSANVRVEIEDTGIGIPAEVRGKLFDPFVTTKVGQGMGLGLALSYKIIRDHRGDIKVLDRSGGGTVFVITLPREDSTRVRVYATEERGRP